MLCRDQDYQSKVLAQVRSHLNSNPLKVLINNAAIQVVKPVEQITPTYWHATLDVNLVAPFLLTQAFLGDLTITQGSIVNIASIHATLTKPEFVCYATSKAALVGLTRSLAVELGDRVRINAITPAAVATPMLLAGFEGKNKAFEELGQMHPIGRIATPQEVAQAALFLASDQASFITGAVLSLDGGIGSRLHDPV
ncbi:MAG: SDR family oxidoreductase [Leptolyngbyaceae cyanobacterium SM1_1_3]|nr:SDR family oxidoreductase [Leptolyngbyaceae cyanobacterium SM1_1_3]